MSKIITFLLFLLFSYFFIPQHVFAQDSQNQVHTFQTSVSTITASNGLITGDVVIENTTQESNSELFLSASLKTPPQAGSKIENGKTIAVMQTGLTISHITSPQFSLRSGEKITKAISLPYPKTVASGSYDIFITIQDSQGNVYGIINQLQVLSGSNQFLTVDTTTCRIIVDNTEYLPSDGPIIEPGKKAIGTCDFKNSTSQVVTGKWEMVYAVDAVVSNPGEEKKIFSDNSVITFGPNQTRSISFSFPSVKTPQVYEGLVKISNFEKEQITPGIAFRWTVPGPSAKIQSVVADKTAYTAGEKALITVVADPSLDLFWAGNPYIEKNKNRSLGSLLKDPKITVKLVNENNKVCGEQTQDVVTTKGKVTWDPQKISVSIMSDCTNPTITASIRDGEKQLATKNKAYVSGEGSDTQKSDAGKNSMLWLGIGVAFVLLIVGLIVWFWRKKRNGSAPPGQTSVQTGIKTGVLLFMVGLIIYSMIQIELLPSLTFHNLKITSVFADNDNENGSSDPPMPTNNGVQTHPGENTAPGVLYLNRHWQYPDGRAGLMNQIVQMQFFPEGQNGTSIVRNADGSFTVTIGTQLQANGCQNMQGCVRALPEIDGSSQGLTINGIETDTIDLYDQVGGNSNVAHSSTFTVSKKTGNVACGPHTLKIKLAVCAGYGSPGTAHSTWYWFDHSLNDNLAVHPSFRLGNNCALTPANGSNGEKMQTCFGSLQKSVDGGPCIACNASCSTATDCQYAANGCTSCLPNPAGTGNTCQTPAPACNSACTNPNDCLRAVNGCTTCVPNDTGTGGTCKPAPACNTSCLRDDQCAGARDGCTTCVPNDTGTGGTCKPAPACGAGCVNDNQCDKAKDGCTACVPKDDGSKVCSPPPACNVACTRDDQCAGARDGCTSCVENDTGTGKSCKPAPACGTACTKDSQCAGAKNGCTMCTAGKCSSFSEDMCSCDGMAFTGPNGAETFFPGDNVTFIAYGKVPGKDWKGDAAGAVSHAQITSMSFALYQSKLSDPNTATLIAQSAAITPQVIENTASKVRYKVTWDKQIPATVPAGTLYRIQAKLKCSAKAGVLGAATSSIGSTNYFTQLFDAVSGMFAKGSVLGETTRNDQHADEFFPGAKVQEKTCTFIKFFFE